MRPFLLLTALLLAPALAHAQASPAVLAAADYLRGQATDARVPSGDLADLHAADVVPHRRSGATFVYLVQRHEGIEVLGTTTPVAVAADGRVLSTSGASRLATDLSTRANAPTPGLEADAALARAITHVSTLRPAPVPTRVSDDAATDAAALARAVRTYVPVGTARLVYQPTDDGALRLAWSLTVETERGAHELWAVRVDAATGVVLAVDDLVDRHTVVPAAAAAPVSFAPLAAPSATALVAPAAGTVSYRALPMPVESPNHGAFALIAGPDDATSSPLGWHDTGSVSYLDTQGNNAWAYEDRSNSNSGAKAPQTSPGVFDHVYDQNAPPAASVNAAITNLFYWGNIIHDVMWHYGFDEAGGNFQTNNFGLGGLGNDVVRLEAQDGSGTDNANFSTPADGGSGRMQMFEWGGAPEIAFLSPASVAGVYPSRGGAFGSGPTVVTANAVLSLTPVGNQSRGCVASDIDNAGDAVGQVIFIQRGDCNFVDKARVAQDLGAAAVVIYNCTPGSVGCSTSSPGEGLITMGCAAGDDCSDVTLPVAFVQESTGNVIVTAPDVVQARFTVGADRDSDFDAGVITHEFGHGISNRLVGGPGAAGCLGTTEQMGEGWSDYYGLMLTMKPGDTPAQPRGVGTYLVFDQIDGVGIRNAPYSTDFSVNDYTYATMIAQGGTGLSIPHGIGFVWATMLWEMTWDLIEAHGFDPDVYNATGAAGNQISLSLVTTGLAEMACSPGFVDGRDGILAADLLLYPDAANPGRGLHHDIIWAAFARRGLGLNASQGSTASVNDGAADFSTPPVAQETRPDGSVVSLVVAGANPFRGTTRLALTLDRPQDVRVEIVDLLGRTVQTLHDGAMSAETEMLEVSSAGLAPGVYVVRAIGEDVVLSERLTVIR